jgi:LCP family protein required for cell wall assembly
MKENRKITLLSKVALGLVGAFLILGAVFVYLYITPMAPEMVVAKSEAPAPLAVVASESKAKATKQKPEKVCGNTGSMLVLLTGEDFSKGTWPLGADTIRVVKVDFSNRKVVVVSFPRDLWVKTPGLADLNFPETRLGLAYYYKKESTNGSDKHKITAATSQIAQALYDNFGLEPKKYFTIQLQSMPEIIDAIGGIDVNVPKGFTSENNIVFEEGPQHMDGARAAEYVRAWAENDDEGDLLRFPRQNLIMKAIRDKILSAEIIAKAPELYKRFEKAAVTDLSLSQMNDLACLAKEVPQENIVFHEIAGDLVTEQADLILMPDVEKVKEILKEWLDL